jgi:hypothetical protein
MLAENQQIEYRKTNHYKLERGLRLIRPRAIHSSARHAADDSQFVTSPRLEKPS